MINAELGTQLEAYVQQLVDAGRYGSKSEVLSEGIRLVQDRETRLAVLDASIARGLADIEAGRTMPAGDVFKRLEEKYRAMAEKSV
ncbi:type II toxin-antitoxin system ParD family antitoxin [Kushneria aurantia]|uniref:Antitoxin ParD n=1 Tax=Kushneria aurantia TaxID=504092 RepID=A0ABV6G814_9GAMM|nr:type II toxin-antitoxin system ParD family antitoxin [Kushneria aurantia]